MPIQARIQMSKFKQDHACVFNKTVKNESNSFVYSLILCLFTK